jgi:glucan phosphoethanolaminetransferase (alkaline phosphatase superfamily)
MENTKVLNKIVYYILGVLEVLFAFRLVFKLLGANFGSGFVSFIYTVSGVFLVPFSTIFRTAVTNGIETKSVLEPSTLIAMVVYAVIAYGIVMLIKIFKAPKGNIQSQSNRETAGNSVVTKVETSTDGTQPQENRNSDNKVN